MKKVEEGVEVQKACASCYVAQQEWARKGGFKEFSCPNCSPADGQSELY